MSSAEYDSNDGGLGLGLGRDLKKRRVQRACDVCRRKKVRCNGGQMPGNRCSNCIAYNLECTYVEAAKKRGPPKGYVESLENRLEKMEALLNQLCPNADFTKELGVPLDRESWVRDRDQHIHRPAELSSIAGPTYKTSRTPIPVALPTPAGLGSSDDEEGFQVDGLSEKLDQFHVGYRFFGKSSEAQLIKTALDFKSAYSGKRMDTIVSHKNPHRQEFWSVHPWEVMGTECEIRAPYVFPELDLMKALVDIYFEQVNSIYPILHRPTFMVDLNEKLYEQDESFGSVVLILCAIASRYSDDARVRLDGVKLWSSSGWKWFTQVRMARKSLLTPPSLFDLQMFCLACIFLHGCSAPQVCWTMCGVGIRLAQDVGAHRRKVYSAQPRIEDELWKRAFWVLVVIDRWMSASLGRPCAIQEEDFDLDFPADCDDEYWEHSDPALSFKQPSDKPSSLSFFISAIRLNQILGFALRTIYSINKSKTLLGFMGPEWEQRIVAELDSTLNKWVDEIPHHLRWPPSSDTPLFFVQSAVLYAHYYQVQIMVHRPFIPSVQKPSKLSFPSLAICTNAARACSHVVDATRRRFPKQRFPDFQLPAFTAGIVLLLHIWGHKRAGQTGAGFDPEQEMQSVHKCMRALKDQEERWHTAGRLWDILFELASVGDLPLPASTPTSKRERDSDSPISVSSSHASASPPAERMIAGARRILNARGSPPMPQSLGHATAGSYAYGTLPMNSNELGGVSGVPAWYGQPIVPPTSGAMNFASSSSANATPTQPTMGPIPPPPPAQPSHAAFVDMLGAMRSSGAPDAVAISSTGMPAGGPQQSMLDALLSGMPVDVNGAAGASAGASGVGAQVDMWSDMPTGYGFDDWDSYITSMSGMQMQQMQPPPR